MKAKPVKIVSGKGYVECSKEDATHLTLNIPSYDFLVTLPIITTGSRAKTGSWTWNRSTELPTLKPSVLTTNGAFRCHSWINDGKVIFLSDCSHEFAGKTVDLLEAI